MINNLISFYLSLSPVLLADTSLIQFSLLLFLLLRLIGVLCQYLKLLNLYLSIRLSSLMSFICFISSLQAVYYEISSTAFELSHVRYMPSFSDQLTPFFFYHLL